MFVFVLKGVNETFQLKLYVVFIVPSIFNLNLKGDWPKI